MMKGADICPFCRTSSSGTDEQLRKELENRVKKNDPLAFFNLGCGYNHGKYGCPQDDAKAVELWHRAGELGHAEAYHNLSVLYLEKVGAQKDMRKAIHYWELAGIILVFQRYKQEMWIEP